MLKVHFYKAQCRLGIIYHPIHQKDFNIGVEDGPDAILTNSFLKKFKENRTSEFNFLKPEEIDRNNYLNIIAENLESFKNLINKTLKANETQVVIGGDNSVTFSSLLALIERVGDAKKIGYIQLDSHGEMNLYKSSPTKNFHGMYMRPFLDSFDVPIISNLVTQKLPLKNTLFIGDQELDEEESIFFKKSKLKNINRKNVLEDRKIVLEYLKKFTSSFEYLHVNFDVDAFNKKGVQATGIPSGNGFKLKELIPLIEVVSKHPRLSLDLSEVNPRKIGIDKTIRIVHEVLLRFLS
ncbi:MAG: arginase family protein [Candidatus Levybacteria bacterium]|nr:arginase family protein [Candidatus Levybacteria bacterium]